MNTTYSERKIRKSGTIKKRDFQFNIRDVPFSRKLSCLLIGEGAAPTESGAERKQLLLDRTLRGYEINRTNAAAPGLMYIRPMYDGRTVPYTCAATPSMLEVNTEYGYAQFCFDGKDLIRARGVGIDLRVYIEMKPHEFCIPRLDGTWQVSFDAAGDFLFAPIKGGVDVDSEWEWKRIGAEKALIDISPDEDGAFELAIHFAMSNVERFASYRDFDECAADARRDYDDWLAMYPAAPGKYEDMKKLAAYCVWICYIAPTGILKDNIVLFDRRSGGAFSWHQAYHAMAAAKNIDIAVQIMRSMFLYQDEYGEIPDIVDERYINILATKPPFHGFAMLFIMERAGDRLTSAHCESLYEPLRKWYEWWMTLRDTDNDGVPQYNQGCESGEDFTMMLSKGVPVECPDLISYIILLGEALGKLAEKMGRLKEAEEWFAKSKKLTGVLIDEFWDGEKFIARMSGSHEIVDFVSIESRSPLMLGARLPKAIIDKMASAMMDPDKFYTHHGFRGAPRQYDGDGKPLPGFIEGFTQIKMIIGLYEAGYKELARDVLIGFCDANLELLPDFGYREAAPTPENGQRQVEAIGFGKCSALSSAIFLVMAGYLAKISKEEQ